MSIFKDRRSFTHKPYRDKEAETDQLGVEDEGKRAAELAADFNTEVLTVIPRDSIFEKAEAAGKTVVELYPDSEVTKILLDAADRIMK